MAQLCSFSGEGSIKSDDYVDAISQALRFLLDKGLVNLKGLTLVHHTLKRLQMQEGLQFKEIMIVANRNIDTYETLGVQVWSDNTPTFEGPLAGFQTGLEKCKTSLLLTVPCDSPFFPLNLADRMRSALIAEDAEIAIAATRDPDGRTQPHSVFCLMSGRSVHGPHFTKPSACHFK